MSAKMMNISDVPFPLWSGRKKDQFFPLEEKNTVVPISLDDF